MFDVMKNRRGPYTGFDIPEFYTLVQELFTPEEAEVNNVMSRKPTTAEDIAKALDKPVRDVHAALFRLRCLCHRLSGRRHLDGGKIGFSGTTQRSERINHFLKGQFCTADLKL
jgi:hypothetical protein